MEAIKLQIANEYRMPPLCCACGAPAGKARFKVYATSIWRRLPYSLYVPLCDGCARAYNAVDQRRRAGCWVGLPLALVLGAAAMLSGGARPWGTMLAILAALAIAGGMVAFLLLPGILPRNLRAPYRRVARAAQIRHYSPQGLLGEGSMVLYLAQPSFAEQFLMLNKHLLWHEPTR